MNKQRNNLYLFFFAILFQACIKEDYCPVDENIKSYLDFKEGSSWTYQEDSTGVIENISVVVRESKYTTKKTDSNNIHIEIITTKYYSSTPHLEYSQYIRSIGVINLICKNSLDSLHSYSTIITINKPDTIKEMEILGKLYHQVSYLKSEALYVNPKYQKPDTTFKSFPKDYWLKYTNEYWIAKNTWIIKKIIRTPKGNFYWSLKNCTIIQ